MKKFSILLAIVMLLTVVAPATLVSADYQEARNSITFDTIKGTNVHGQFNVTEPLSFPETVQGYRTEWRVSNTDVISADGQTINQIGVAQWVTITARVYNEESTSYVERDIKVRVPAVGNYILNETFEDETAGQLTNTTNAADTWYISGNAADAGTTFTFTDDNGTNISGKALQMSARASGSNYFATMDLSELPASGTVSFASDVRFSGSSISFPYWPFWHVKGLSYFSYPSQYGTLSVDYDFGINAWHHVETVYDFDLNRLDTYVDGVWVAGDNKIQTYTKNALGKIQARMQANTGVGSFNYIDNIQVKYVLKDEKAALIAFNPATKGNIYVDRNLASTVNLNGAVYPVSYASSDESVIAADGTVTFSDFFRTVTVTPQVKFGDTVLSGTATQLTVLPMNTNYSIRLDENFENIDVITEASGDAAGNTNVEAGDMFDATGASVDTDSIWSLASDWKENYRIEYPNGSRVQIVTDNNQKTLRIKKVSSSTNKDYRLQIATTNEACGDRVAMSMRVKLVGGAMNLSTPYTGRLRPWFRGDFGGAGLGTDVENISYDNNWHTYLFVYDSGIVETKSEVQAYPISLYIDGVYKGTSWTKDPAGYLPANSIYLMQWATHGASEVLVDDMLLMNFDSDAIQLAGATVNSGTLQSADVQYVSYEQNMDAAKKLLVASYKDNDELVAVKTVDASAATSVGMNTVNVGYALPQDAAYFRLFLFDGLTNIKPLALTRIYNIK